MIRGSATTTTTAPMTRAYPLSVSAPTSDITHSDAAGKPTTKAASLSTPCANTTLAPGGEGARGDGGSDGGDGLAMGRAGAMGPRGTGAVKRVSQAPISRRSPQLHFHDALRARAKAVNHRGGWAV